MHPHICVRQARRPVYVTHGGRLQNGVMRVDSDGRLAAAVTLVIKMSNRTTAGVAFAAHA